MPNRKPGKSGGAVVTGAELRKLMECVGGAQMRELGAFIFKLVSQGRSPDRAMELAKEKYAELWPLIKPHSQPRGPDPNGGLPASRRRGRRRRTHR